MGAYIAPCQELSFRYTVINKIRGHKLLKSISEQELVSAKIGIPNFESKAYRKAAGK